MMIASVFIFILPFLRKAIYSLKEEESIKYVLD